MGFKGSRRMGDQSWAIKIIPRFLYFIYKSNYCIKIFYLYFPSFFLYMNACILFSTSASKFNF